MQQRLIVILLVTATFWPIACAMFIYVSNHLELLQGFGVGGDVREFLKIDSTFFMVFMTAQSTFAIVLAAFAGPSLIAPDLANGGLPLYFSRPMSRPEYVLSRMLVLVGLLSPVTWVAGVLLFLMQSGMAGWMWFSEHWDLGVAVFAGFAIWILFVSLVAMASSAYVKWRIVAGALVLGIFFVMAGAAELTNAVLRVDWASAFNPARAMHQVWRWMLGADPIPGPEAWQCAIAISIMALLLVVVLERKLRPVEVIR
jgi:ABC-2 type transport system permease protein